MTRGLLLDTHILLWLEKGSPFTVDALLAIEGASLLNKLFASHISIWELGVALRKKQVQRRPDLGDLLPAAWFNKTCSRFNVRPLSLSSLIAAEAALVPSIYGSGDPGDCFLIATARIRRLSLATRDKQALKLSNRKPDYLTTLAC
jgi:PIN domain nuclease of toxin-antitoxin system